MKSPSSKIQARAANPDAGARAPRKALKPKRPAQRQAGRPTAAELERRKRIVMEVATTLFIEEGYAATSLVEIAKGAGVATRTLYQHFGDKEAIFFAVVTARETGAVFEHSTIPADATLESALLQLAEEICEVALRSRSVGLMRLVIAESRRFPQFMRTLLEKTFTHFRANISEVFEELADRGLTPALDPRTSASLFHDLVLGNTPLFVYAGWDASLPTRAELQGKVDLFIHGRFAHAALTPPRRTAGRRLPAG